MHAGRTANPLTNLILCQTNSTRRQDEFKLRAQSLNSHATVLKFHHALKTCKAHGQSSYQSDPAKLL
jgi:hypothetical protein